MNKQYVWSISVKTENRGWRTIYADSIESIELLIGRQFENWRVKPERVINNADYVVWDVADGNNLEAYRHEVFTAETIAWPL